MSFIWPVMLLLLSLLPLFGLLYIMLQQRRRRIAERFGSLGLVQGSMGRSLGMRRHIPPALFMTSLTILIFGLARPQALVSLPRVEGTLMLVFDVSGSMAAEDLKPTRMEAAKAAARDFVQGQPAGVQIGVVAFSDGGLAVLAPTDDQEAILASIDRLAPQRGTSLANGILAALNALDAGSGQSSPSDGDLAPSTPEARVGTIESQEKYTSAAMVLLSDGENTAPPEPFAAAQTAADLGVRIYTVGIGSAAGTDLSVDGFTVHTQLDEATLQQIAQLTEGAYYNAQNEQDLNAVYSDLGRQLVIKPEKMEVTSIFAGASILVMLIGGVFSLLWFSRLP